MSGSVSVVIPVFNGGKTIARAIQSVLDQSHEVNEVIVIDDCSSDNTLLHVEALQAISSIPIRILTTEVNSGPASARNLGWGHASGDFIAFLDADDIWHPEKISLQLRLMALNPEFVLSCHDRSVGEWTGWTNSISATPRVYEYSIRDFLIRNRCATPSVVLRRSIKERFTETARFAEDYLLWLTIAARYGPVLYLDTPLVHCSNPSYGGVGLSGQLFAMYKHELLAFRLLKKSQDLGPLVMLGAWMWSTIKFLVRLLDNYILKGRIQTVSESR
jgi:glycosyltransferase involved in cell wall biosynthesis